MIFADMARITEKLVEPVQDGGGGNFAVGSSMKLFVRHLLVNSLHRPTPPS